MAILKTYSCACDVPAHNYTYSFEPKADWSRVYAKSSEIKGYFDQFSKRYSLPKYVKFLHTVREAQWIETEGEWIVKVEDTTSGAKSSDHCHILINAGGHLNNWVWPDLPGKEDYQGQMVHSANWDKDIYLEGKTIGLVGNG